MDDTMTEVDGLLAQLAAGNMAARDRLFARLNDRVCRIARQMLHGRFSQIEQYEQTDDIVQEAYLRLLQKWDSVTAPAPGAVALCADEYLTRTATLLRDVLVELARKHLGRITLKPRKVSLHASGPGGVGLGHDPESETHDPAKLVLFIEFYEAMRDLPPDLRQVVDWHWCHEFSHRQVAQRLGIAEKTSEKRWQKARLQLAKRFNGDPFNWFRD